MLPCWPDHDTIRDTMPAVFREQYHRTTVILDATEISSQQTFFFAATVTDIQQL